MTKRERAKVKEARRCIGLFFGSSEGDPTYLREADQLLRAILGLPTSPDPTDGIRPVTIDQLPQGSYPFRWEKS